MRLLQSQTCYWGRPNSPLFQRNCANNGSGCEIVGTILPLTSQECNTATCNSRSSTSRHVDDCLPMVANCVKSKKLCWQFIAMAVTYLSLCFRSRKESCSTHPCTSRRCNSRSCTFRHVDDCLPMAARCTKSKSYFAARPRKR